MTKDLTHGSPLKLILGFAVPIYLGLLFQQLYNVVDTIIVGKFLGIPQLAGVGSTGSLNFMVMGFCIGLCSGFSIPAAQRFGAGDESGLRRCAANSCWLCIFFAVLITVSVSSFCRPILQLMRTPEEIIGFAYDYIFIIFLGIPFTFFYNILSGILRSLGDSRTPVYFLVFSSILNILLDLVFILLLGMGVRGPALATVLSQMISGVICFLYMRKKYPILHMNREEMLPDGACMLKLCAMGIPMGLQYSVTAIGILIIQKTTNGFGTSVVAGVTAAQRIHTFLACPIEALGSTMASYTGQNTGAGAYDRILKGTLQASLTGFVISAVLLLVVLAGGRWMIGCFLDVPDPEVIGCAQKIMLYTTAFYPLLGLVNIVRFSIQGMGYSLLSIVSGMLELAARALAGLVLAPRLGFTGVCLAHPLAWIFADLFLIPAFVFCRRRIAEQGKRR